MKTFALTILFFAVFALQGQNSQANQPNEAVTVLTLDDCVNYALENNITLKRARNGELAAKANHFQAIMNYFPSLNASTNYDFFFGNFFDQNAARQVSETTNSSNPRLSSSLVLFNGFANQYNLKQRIQERKAAEENVKSTQLTVQTNILFFYLSVATSKETVKVSQDRVNNLQEQLDREVKRIEVGVGDPQTAYQLRGQLSNEKLNLTNARNQLRSNLLLLVQEMQLDTEVAYDISTAEVSDEDLLLEIDPFDVVLSESVNINPQLKGTEANYAASRYALKGARAARIPTFRVSGTLGSNYSSNGARNPETGEFEADATFSDQIEFNKFEYVNFSVNIPIFNQYQTSTNVQVAKVGFLNAELDRQATINTITNTVQRVYLDLVAGQQTYLSARENMEAQNSSFEFVKKRFDVGSTDFNSYLQSLRNKNQAEFQLVSSKYEILFRKKILDLYRGI
ncbi:MAG: TolC family protein [Cyclobacteriaceae bacterium]